MVSNHKPKSIITFLYALNNDFRAYAHHFKPSTRITSALLQTQVCAHLLRDHKNGCRARWRAGGESSKLLCHRCEILWCAPSHGVQRIGKGVDGKGARVTTPFSMGVKDRSARG